MICKVPNSINCGEAVYARTHTVALAILLADESEEKYASILTLNNGRKKRHILVVFWFGMKEC